jgi:hypothetical protein
LVGRFYFMDRPLINLDYIVVGILWRWLPGWLRIAGFAVVFIIDVITSTGSMYNINPVAGVVALFRAPIGLLITVVLVFAVSCALAAGLGALVNHFVRQPAQRFVMATSLAACAVILLLTVPARSSVARFSGDIVERDRGYRRTPPRMAAATDALRRDLSEQRDNVAIVVVESWGLLADSVQRKQLFDIFDTSALRERYQLRYGSVPFRGGTTSGELRELCGVFTDYLVLNQPTIDTCLPSQLRRRGFTSVALHGYLRNYYSRDQWYPRLFDRMLFEDSLAASEKRCGTQFRGICDREVFHAFAREVSTANRQLTYWLSIDAHTPVDVARKSEFALSDCRAPEDFCLVVAFWRDLLQQVAALAADPATPRTRFVLVGDHAPAFVLRSRADHLTQGRVPFIELVPR